MQNPNVPNQNDVPIDHRHGDYQPNIHVGQNNLPGHGYNTNNAYQSPYTPNFDGSNQMNNYNTGQHTNSIPQETRPIVIINDNTERASTGTYARPNHVHRGSGRSLADHIQCINCHQTGYVFIHPEIDPCYCCLIVILTIIFFPFIEFFYIYSTF